MSQIEIACKELVFHFNKKHLEDHTVPMWIIKAKGESYYVNHVTCELAWSTKETPDNSHTKGSIKIKKCLLVIDDDNCATISHLSAEDEARLSGKSKIIRIITTSGYELKKFLDNRPHGVVKTMGGACSRTFYVSEIYSEKLLTLALLAVPNLRVLMPNEDYYKWYDQFEQEDIDIDAIDYDDLYED